MRFYVSLAFAFLLAAHAAADVLQNEIDDGGRLTVAASVRLGPWVRPGAWAVMSVRVEHDAEPFLGLVHIRSTSAAGEGACYSSSPRSFDRGSTGIDLLFAHDGHVLGWRIEIEKVSSGERAGIVFRADASSVMRPLSSGDRYLLAVGVRAFPLPSADSAEGARVASSAIEAGELPTADEAYGSCDIVVVERVQRSAVSSRRTAALKSFVLGGGSVVFVSFRALSALGPEMADVREELDGRPLVEAPGLPPRAEAAFGFGRVVAFAAEPGDQIWQRPAASALIAELCRRPVRSPWVDAAALEAFSPERPFAVASGRTRAAAILGSVLVTLIVVLSASRARWIAAASVLAGGLLVALLILFIWPRGAGSVQVVVAKVFSADGRAERTLETLTLSAAQDQGRIEIDSAASPLRPVSRREGSLGAEEFTLEHRGENWRFSAAPAAGTGAVRVRSCAVGAISDEGLRWRERVLVERKLASAILRDTEADGSAGRNSARLVTYLVRRISADSKKTAWQWRDEWPSGFTVAGFDPAPGSGYLVLSPIPEREKARPKD